MNLKDVLSKTDIDRKSKVLIVLDSGEQSPKALAEIRQTLLGNGIREAKNWNISQILGQLKGQAILVDKRWEITLEGRKRLANLGIGKSLPTTSELSSLRAHAASIKNNQIKAFIEEAISALEYRLFRAAVVFSWVGAMGLLYEHVLQNCLTPFNQEATKRNPKWKAAKSSDDLALMRENDFLQILPTISVIGKNVKQELEQCLTLRNACGHPSSLSIAEHRVAAHLEILILNVYSKFKA
ncbi:MAG: hypothetical protein JO170_13935 [Verrucomicrobia bacterium]|nr:hypothetical protein [Verrucomicrobiota bacterium]